MSWFRGPGRGRAFLRFVAAVVWTIAAYVLSERAAQVFTQGAAFPLIRDLFALLLFLVGYSYMGMMWDRARDPLRMIGFVARRGAAREFGLGAALGWGMVAVFFLVLIGVGQFYIRLSGSPDAWGKLILQLSILAVGSLVAETAFRGYPFQKLIEATGPFTATVLAGLFFGLVQIESPVAAPAAAEWVSGVAAVVLSIAYLRTRALWLCWGLHFTWLASIGILFGQPLAGSRQASSVIQTYADGPTWLTGSEYGPEGSVVALAILWVGLLLVFLLTRGLARMNRPAVRLAGIPSDIRSFKPPVDSQNPPPQNRQPDPSWPSSTHSLPPQPGDPPQPVHGEPGPEIAASTAPGRRAIDDSAGDSSAPVTASREPVSSLETREESPFAVSNRPLEPPPDR